MIEPGFLHDQVDQAEAALLKADIGVYQRGQDLVRVVTLPHSVGDDGVSRATGTLLIKPVASTWLRENLGRVCRWYRMQKPRAVACDAPATHALALLARRRCRVRSHRLVHRVGDRAKRVVSSSLNLCPGIPRLSMCCMPAGWTEHLLVSNNVRPVATMDLEEEKALL